MLNEKKSALSIFLYGKIIKQYFLEKDGWIKMQFRGISPPKVGEHIFVPYKDSIFILNLNAGFSQIFRIIMGTL